MVQVATMVLRELISFNRFLLPESSWIPFAFKQQPKGPVSKRGAAPALELHVPVLEALGARMSVGNRSAS